MANTGLLYLRESLLFSDTDMNDYYSAYNDKQLRYELKQYRKYVLERLDDIQNEILHTHDKLNISIEMFKELPTEDIYKQLILYMDQVVIPDPLFEQTEEMSDVSNIVGQYLGMSSSDSLDRKKIVDAIRYIKGISLMIVAGFIVMYPVSFIHEAPKKLSIKYSPTAFSEVIPEDILEYYHSIAKVYNAEQGDDGLRIFPEKKLTLGTSIGIEFPDNMNSNLYMYHYMLQEILSLDKETGRVQTRMYSPETIDKNTFIYWVNQSVNQAANRHFGEKYMELVLARKCGCMYLSRSPLTAKVLQMGIEKTSKEAELTTMALQLELPVMNQISLEDVLEIRNNYGEAFHNFRNELNAKLVALDAINDQDTFRSELDRISYELSNVQVKEVEKEYRKIRRTLKLDAWAISASLIASYATGGLTAVGAAGAFVKGVSDIGKYYTDVSEHNGLFLWKLNNRAKKYEV